jgi:hypothetical protein
VCRPSLRISEILDYDYEHGDLATIKRDSLTQVPALITSLSKEFSSAIFHPYAVSEAGGSTFPRVKIVGVVVVNGPGARATAPN